MWMSLLCGKNVKECLMSGFGCIDRRFVSLNKEERSVTLLDLLFCCGDGGRYGAECFKCFSVFEKKEMSNVWSRTSCYITFTEMKDIWKLILDLYERTGCSTSGHILVNCIQIS